MAFQSVCEFSKTSRLRRHRHRHRRRRRRRRPPPPHHRHRHRHRHHSHHHRSLLSPWRMDWYIYTKQLISSLPISMHDS